MRTAVTFTIRQYGAVPCSSVLVLADTCGLQVLGDKEPFLRIGPTPDILGDLPLILVEAPIQGRYDDISICTYRFGGTRLMP
jgi:hypothetical protein